MTDTITSTDAARNMPNWRQLREDHLMELRMLDVIDNRLDGATDINIPTLSRLLKVPMEYVGVIFDRNPRMFTIVCSHSRNLRRTVKPPEYRRSSKTQNPRLLWAMQSLNEKGWQIDQL